jgi:hypothetical protein
VPTGCLIALLPSPKPPLSRLGAKSRPLLSILGLVHLSLPLSPLLSPPGKATGGLLSAPKQAGFSTYQKGGGFLRHTYGFKNPTYKNVPACIKNYTKIKVS